MVDTLKASEDGLKIVYQAGRKKGWRKTSLKWIEEGKTSEATIKRFWRKLAIDRFTFIAICQAVGVNWKEVAELSEIQEIELPVVSPVKDTPPIPNQNFIGRENAIAHLKTKINQGAKIILIQAAAGIGKTTLATEFLKNQNFDKILYLTMAKERETISPVETIVEEWLKKDFEEEPGRDFMVSLGRLKRLLQTQKIGILIDNLEPALDSEFRFIEPHLGYIELLRMLTDSMVQSVTLITSRERLCEGDITVETYRLPELDYCAWKQYFEYYQINNYQSILTEMHKVYGGNAKAMRILCGAVQEDDQGDIQSYWNCNKAEILAKPDLKNLVNSQFNRLQKLDINAFKLLCRLGCYRYQDVPTVPDNGLLCLLWDVPEGEQRRVIESLKNRSLVEVNKGEFFLHPMVREEAIARLRKSEDWEEANCKAAEFWTDSVKTIETVQDALRAFEAYHHYVSISKFELAGEILIKERKNKWSKWKKTGEIFCRSLYKLGILQSTIKAISFIIHELKPSYTLSKIYNTLGNLYWLTGNIKQAIQSHQEALVLADEIIKSNNMNNYQIMLEAIKLYSVFNIGCCYLYLGETKEAIEILEQVKLTSGKTNNTLVVQALCCLAFLYSEMGCKQKALQLALPIYKQIITPEWGAWSSGHSLFFLGLTYKNVQKYETSSLMYEQAVFIAKNSSFIVIEARASYGLAELYRIKGEFATALTYHLESIELLEKIGAKCDLAEANYQLALTYQQMGDRENSKPNFDNAIQLFTEIEAPRQVERVIKSIINE